MPAKTQTRKANKGKTKRTTRKTTAESKSALATPSVVKAATQTVSITKAKGRPMLTWVGKRPLTQVVAFPAQHIETFDPDSDAVRRKEIMWKDWPKAYPHGGLLFHGDESNRCQVYTLDKESYNMVAIGHGTATEDRISGSLLSCYLPWE